MVVDVYSGLTSRLWTISHAIWLMENSDDREKELIILWPITKDCYINAKKVFVPDQSLKTKVKIINYRKRRADKPIDIRKKPIRSMVNMIYNLAAYCYDIVFGMAKVKRLKRARDVYDFDPPIEIGWEDGKALGNYTQSIWNELRDGLRSSTDVYIHAYCGIVHDPNVRIDALYGIDFLPQYYNSASRILSDYKQENLVGVHIRRTDHKSCIENSPLELFVDKMDELIEQDKNVHFFLATDDKKTQEYLMAKYGCRIIVQNKVWGRDTKKAMWGGILDCLCLSKCKVILGSCGSVFSNFAAKCGGIEMMPMVKASADRGIS